MTAARPMIHPSATVDRGARLDTGVRVEAHANIGPGVEIQAGTRVGTHAVILGPTRVGRDNVIHAHACIGDAPQDLAYRGEPTRLEIGDRNVIREFATIHRGTPKDAGRTRVGDEGYFMAYSHIAHDCDVGDRVIMANAVTLGGHVEVETGVNFGGLSAVHQFVRIGRHAMLGGGSMVSQDIPPYMLVAGNRARLLGLNRHGLERAGFTPDAIAALKHAYRVLFRSGRRLTEAMAELRNTTELTPEVTHLLMFLENSQRGVTR